MSDNSNISNTSILLSNLYLELPSHTSQKHKEEDNRVLVGTLVSNLLFYGYIPSTKAMEALNKASASELTTFWNKLEPSLKHITGASRQMDKHVVYKNFPKEVLEKSQAEYWIAQIFMYFGAPNDLFTQEPVERASLFEKVQLKVLQLADVNTLKSIFDRLVKSPARWTNDQQDFAKHLVVELSVPEISADSFSFKENALNLINSVIHNDKLKTSIRCTMSNATDVVRLCSAMSEQDISLRGKVKFKKFSRLERRLVLGMLNNCKNLIEDMALRPELFKHLMKQLHPGDYKFEKVTQAYDKLYKGDYQTFNGKVEAMVNAKALDVSVMKELTHRPGDFVRRFHKMVSLFGDSVLVPFKKVVSELTTVQLLKLDGYIKTINDRKSLIFAPNGNWTKAQFVENKKTALTDKVQIAVHKMIHEELAFRLNSKFEHGVVLDERLKDVKLQTNDQELATYGRGTSFDIPENIRFIRSASYWKDPDAHSYGGNTWYDNGFNLFNDKWKPLGTCCWNSNNALNGTVVFSGDPTNSKTVDGDACQMIDLYLDKMKEHGVRYAVWNILCYNKKSFDEVPEVLASLQFGEHAMKGKLFEPSRAQMVFPLKGKNLTKYVAYIDVEARKLVYMDANLYGNVQSAQSNEDIVSQKMPAFIEYLNSLPSVKDLFKHVETEADELAVPVLYDDKDFSIGKKVTVEGQKEEAKTVAYVFKPVNESNVYEPLDINAILSEKRADPPTMVSIKKSKNSAVR